MVSAVGARLSPEQLATIASAPPGISERALARQLGRPHTTVGARLRAIRRAGGWYCRLTLVPCTECGLPVAGPARRTAHVGCRRARENARKRRAYARWTPAQRAASWARAHAADRRDERIAREAARHLGERWTLEDEAYVLSHPRAAARDLALALGRTVWAVKARGRVLRERRQASP